MKFLKLILFIPLMELIPNELNSQTDSEFIFSLLEAQQFANENYYLSLNSKLDIDASRKKIWETTAIGLPQVSANGNYQYIPGELPTIEFAPGEIIELGVKQNFNYTATVSQLIFSGEYIVGLQAARVYKSLAEENHELTRINIRENIAGSYFAILVLEENERVLSKTIDNLNVSLEYTTKSFEQGFVEDTEVDQISIQVKRTENSLTAVKNQIFYMRNLLKYQLGLQTNSKVILTDSLNYLLTVNNVDTTFYRFNLNENIQYHILETNEELMKLSTNRERSTLLPIVSGFYQYTDNTRTSDFNFTMNHSMGLQITVPIFQSGMKAAKISQAKIAYEQAKNQKEQESERLLLEAQQAINNYKDAYKLYINEKENIDLSEKLLDKTTIKFKQGLVSSLDLSIINNQFLQAQLSFSNAIQNVLASKIALDKAFNKL